MSQFPPPRWPEADLAVEVTKARDIFRKERIDEPVEIFSDFFDTYRNAVEDILEESVDLKELASVVEEYIVDADKRYALRYLASPLISDDDLKTLAETKLSRKALEDDPDAVGRIVDTVLAVHDRWRFPWVSDDRPPTDEERRTAIIATTSMIAASRAQTARRNTSKEQQEELITSTLLDIGFQQVPNRTINNLREAPNPGEFCRESLLGGNKADLVVGLWDNRILPIEAKVSNSTVNSFKRINHDAAAKATEWIRKFGVDGVVPAAVISGVYSVSNLLSAQEVGLSIFWAHDLDRLVEFVNSTKP